MPSLPTVFCTLFYCAPLPTSSGPCWPSSGGMYGDGLAVGSCCTHNGSVVLRALCVAKLQLVFVVGPAIVSSERVWGCLGCRWEYVVVGNVKILKYVTIKTVYVV
jgi:hypothetical protein